MATVRQLLEAKGSDVVSIDGGETVLAAATLMNAREIGCLVVTERSQMTGILTERDILERVVAENLEPSATTVRDVMTRRVITCCPDATPHECVRQMTAEKIRHLPILEGGDLCGVLTSGDILAFQLQGQRDTIEYLNQQVLHARQRRRATPPLHPRQRRVV
jgi:CBS domain-containing protein